MKVYIYEHVTCAPEKAAVQNQIEHGFAWRLKAGCKQMNMKEFDKYMAFIRKICLIRIWYFYRLGIFGCNILICGVSIMIKSPLVLMKGWF